MSVTLDNSVAGAIGLDDDDDTVLSCVFDKNTIMLDDRSGHITPLRAGTYDGLEADGATRTSCYQQTANTPAAWVGTDIAGQSQVLTRDVSVQWIGTLLVAANVFDGRVANRGLGGSAPERQSWCVYFDTDSAAPLITLGFQWDDIGGTSRQSVVELPTWVPTNAWTLWTVTRRWESAASVVMRCYVGDQLAAEWTSSHGDIGGATTATTVVLGGDGFAGKIEQLKVVSREISHEEVQQTWARLSRHQPEGEQAVQALSPPGAPWYRSATSGPARLARLAGQALGYAAAKGHELRETFLPSTAYRDVLARWERLVAARVATADSLDDRRARVVARLARENGYATAQVQEILAEAFDQDAADVELLEFSADVTDTFAGLDARRWLNRPRSATSWSALSSTARVTATSGTDLRYEPGLTNGPTLELAVGSGAGAYFACQITRTTLPADAEAGILLRHGRGDRVWFGVTGVSGGASEVRYQRWRDGVLVDSAPVALATTGTGDHWLRVRGMPGTAFLGAGEQPLQFEWSEDGINFDIRSSITWVRDHQWAGFYVRGLDSALASNVDVRFSKLLAREPNGWRAARWYAYRNLGLGGAPNMEAAQSLVTAVKPAHTYAAAISSLDVLCDDAGSGCNRGPLGAL